MDILDILLARSSSSSTSSSSTDVTARKMAKQASKDADIATSTANQALTEIEEVRNTLPEVEIEESNEPTVVETRVKTKKKTGRIRNYKQRGQNEDGSMTQKAITDIYDELDQKISSGSAAVNMGSENHGSVVVVDDDGSIKAGKVTEASIINTQIQTGTYTAANAVGIEIDYENKTCTRLQKSTTKNAGEDFNEFPMYGGIRRCLVDDNGEIICFYGDDIYEDEYTSGYQTMVYIPKFYYMRVPTKIDNEVIKKEVILLSAETQTGFKVHPAFINAAGEEVDYFLYSAYEGSTFDVSANQYNREDGAFDISEDKLSSIVEAKPMGGLNAELTINNAEQLAQNRGADWHITSFKAESAIQMLFIVEYCTLNAQQAVEMGISNMPSSPVYNCSSYTGSTASLGNTTGHATSTVNERGGETVTYSDNGRRAVSYRGIEDLWGNIWRFIGGLQIRGFGTNKGGIPYICENLNYSSGNYKSVGFALPNVSDWISAFGYVNEEFDWAFLPVEAYGGTSLSPVGDYIWVQPNLNGVNAGVLGGHWGFSDSNGIFYYGFDKAITYSSRAFGARLMLVPSKDEIYQANLLTWKSSIGG